MSEWTCQKCGKPTRENTDFCLSCAMGKSELASASGSVRSRGADALAYQCALLVMRGLLDSRSGVADALLNYLNVGGLDGPKDVPEWMRAYEALNTEVSQREVDR